MLLRKFGILIFGKLFGPVHFPIFVRYQWLANMNVIQDQADPNWDSFRIPTLDWEHQSLFLLTLSEISADTFRWNHFPFGPITVIL